MTKSKIQLASENVKALDSETQALLESVKNKNNKAIKWFIISWTILFSLAIFGIYKQNIIASQSKNHIDCIIKDLATPLPHGSRAKYITRLNSDCQIKFTK